jgi:hypothetical protein
MKQQQKKWKLLRQGGNKDTKGGDAAAKAAEVVGSLPLRKKSWVLLRQQILKKI